MIYRKKNYSRSHIDDVSPLSGDVFVGCNLSQSNPHTKIFDGISGITFESCNLVNCDLPDNSIVNKCLNIHKSMCSHIHQNRVESGEIDPCNVDNCEHVVDTDYVVIDGSTISIYHYDDKVVD